AARAQVAADRLSVTAKSTADSVSAAIAQSYLSSKTEDLVWLEDFVLADDSAAGVLGLSADSLTFPIELNAALSEEVFTGGIWLEPGNEWVRLDSQNHKLYVKDGLTIAQLLQVLHADGDVFLEFYDDNGYYIPEKYYDIAILEDNFVLKLVHDDTVIEEYKFEAVASSILRYLDLTSPRTGDSFSTGIVTLAMLSLAGVFLFGRKIRPQA
ncbi:MAG: hypothetical protein IJT66_01240, partial [Clostridia bacterium]|nr:hypothetical protein [Clostridia bacterium]